MRKKTFDTVLEAIRFTKEHDVKIIYIASKDEKCELVYRLD